MKRILELSVLNLLLISFTGTLKSQEITLRQPASSGIYRKGQKISVYLLPGPQRTDSVYIRVLKNNDQLIEKRSFKPDKDVIQVFAGSFKRSCSVIVEARMQNVTSSIGFVVDPAGFKPAVGRTS